MCNDRMVLRGNLKACCLIAPTTLHCTTTMYCGRSVQGTHSIHHALCEFECTLRGRTLPAHEALCMPEDARVKGAANAFEPNPLNVKLSKLAETLRSTARRHRHLRVGLKPSIYLSQISRLRQKHNKIGTKDKCTSKWNEAVVPNDRNKQGHRSECVQLTLDSNSFTYANHH